MTGWSLDSHAAKRAGVLACKNFLTRDDIEKWQARALREIVFYAKQKSPFYSRLFKNLKDARVESPLDLKSLPFTDARSLKEDPHAFLCVAPDEVARVATFAASSGTSGPPKRIFFTGEDLESTIDFFAAGMAHIPGTRTLICMGEPDRETATPGSVAALLTEALSRAGRVGLAGGFVTDPDKTIEQIRASNADSIVGVPSQILALSRRLLSEKEKIPLKGVLLSGEYASEGLPGALRDVFGKGCQIFRHFGMAETGYGAAVECALHDGLHIREADLLVEIAAVGGDEILPDGEWGEIVITTLTRRGMPLIRFRTGDSGRILSGFCKCGSVLRRLSAAGRLDNVLTLPTGAARLSELDEALHPLPWLSDYDAGAKLVKLVKLVKNAAAVLSLTLYCPGECPDDWLAQTRRAVETIAPLREALSSGALRLDLELSRRAISPYAGKKIFLTR